MERRKRTRFTLSDPLDSSVQTAFDAKMLDLSLDGVLLESARPLSAGTGCQIRVQHDEGDFLLYATVRNCRAGGLKAENERHKTALFHMGLQFNEKGRFAVKELLARVPAFVRNGGGTEETGGTAEEEQRAASRQESQVDDRWRTNLDIPVSVRVGKEETLEPHMLDVPADGSDRPELGEGETPKGVLRLEKAK